MDDTLKLMCILAHPDDESLGTGGILARYAAEGVATSLVCATRGERGWTGLDNAYPGLEALGQIREMELIQAARVLGLRQVRLLNFIDGDLDQADPRGVVPQIAALLRQIRPQVVVTFDPRGAYGHPDHIAICQFTHAALVLAADSCANLDGDPHQVLKLYYLIDTAADWDAYLSLFGDIRMNVDGVERCPTPWEDWAVTTRVDTSLYRDIVWQAVACHLTQIPGHDDFRRSLARSNLWSTQSFYRAMSLVNSGRQIEDDLFAGIRNPLPATEYATMRTPCQPAVSL
ncbi:MAG: PIG-L deacetylase family protein [Bellilinea sp.]